MIIKNNNDYLQKLPKRKKTFDEMPVSGLCFAGGVPGVEKRARYDAIDRSLEETSFCVVSPASRNRVAEKFSLDFLILFYQEKRTKKEGTTGEFTGLGHFVDNHKNNINFDAFALNNVNFMSYL